jgi:hypothetical protein
MSKRQMATLVQERKQALMEAIIQQQQSAAQYNFDILFDDDLIDLIDQDYYVLDAYDFIEDMDITPERKTRRDVMTAIESIKAKKSSKYYKMRPRNPRADRTKSIEKKLASIKRRV